MKNFLVLLIMGFVFFSCKKKKVFTSSDYRCGTESKWGVQYCKDLSKEDYYVIYHHGIKICEGIPSEKTDLIDGKMFYKNNLYDGYIFDGFDNSLSYTFKYSKGKLMVLNEYSHSIRNNMTSHRSVKKMIFKNGEVEKIIYKGKLDEIMKNNYKSTYTNIDYETGVRYFNGDEIIDSTCYYYPDGKMKLSNKLIIK